MAAERSKAPWARLRLRVPEDAAESLGVACIERGATGTITGQRDLRREQALAALDTVDLAYAAQRPARSLSGGEQQRLSIARAQALQPDCLLLDEPTASLDPAAGAAVERYLMQLAQQGFGLVMCTHDLALARRFAQDAVLLHQGRVIESGRAQAFFESPRTDQARRFLAGEWLDQS